MSRVLVVDPMLWTAEGHHLAVSTLLHDEALRRGQKPEVYGNVGFPEGLTAYPVQRVFRSVFYGSLETRLLSQALHAVSGEQLKLLQDLARALPPSSLQPDDVVVFHTVLPEHLLGIRDWYAACPETVRLRIIMRFPPSFRRPGLEDLDAFVCAMAATAWRRFGRDVRFYSDNQQLATYYTSLMQIPFGVTPVALNFHGTVPTRGTADPDKGVIFLFAGGGRPEKGAGLLPGAWRRHVAAFPKDRLIAQRLFLTPQDAEAWNHLGPTAEFVDGALHGADYLTFMAVGDAVLVPYNKPSYAYRTSHILLEALGMGRPVVTTADTWMHEQLAAQQPTAGVVLDAWTDEGLADALARTRQDIVALQDGAWQAAARVRAEHCAENFYTVFVGDGAPVAPGAVGPG